MIKTENAPMGLQYSVTSASQMLLDVTHLSPDILNGPYNIVYICYCTLGRTKGINQVFLLLYGTRECVQNQNWKLGFFKEVGRSSSFSFFCGRM